MGYRSNEQRFSQGIWSISRLDGRGNPEMKGMSYGAFFQGVDEVEGEDFLGSEEALALSEYIRGHIKIPDEHYIKEGHLMSSSTGGDVVASAGCTCGLSYDFIDREIQHERHLGVVASRAARERAADDILATIDLDKRMHDPVWREAMEYAAQIARVGQGVVVDDE